MFRLALPHRSSRLNSSGINFTQRRFLKSPLDRPEKVSTIFSFAELKQHVPAELAGMLDLKKDPVIEKLISQRQLQPEKISALQNEVREFLKGKFDDVLFTHQEVRLVKNGLIFSVFPSKNQDYYPASVRIFSNTVKDQGEGSELQFFGQLRKNSLDISHARTFSVNSSYHSEFAVPIDHTKYPELVSLIESLGEASQLYQAAERVEPLHQTYRLAAFNKRLSEFFVSDFEVSVT